MKLSRTFAKTGLILIYLVALTLSIYGLTRSHPAEPVNEKSSLITIDYIWKGSHKPEDMEAKVTAVLENWLTSIHGIASFHSETFSSHGRITVIPERDADPSRIIARLRYLLKLRRFELPDEFAGIDIDHVNSTRKSLEIFLLQPYTKQFAESLSAYLA
ncbi:MAG: hypothetical protein P8X57_13505, partial [Cyclobacteriaceae bacterium]